MIRKNALAFVCLLVSGVASQAASNCELGSIRLIQDVAVTGYMEVKAGKGCGIQVGHSLGGATGIEVTKRPVHGRVQTQGLGIVYFARPGFSGKDSFSYVRHARDETNGRPVRFPVNVQVTVRP